MADPVITAKTILLIYELVSAMPPPAPRDPARPPPMQPTITKEQGIAEVAERVIRCYHPTARFKTVDVIEKPWKRQGQYKADASAVLRIRWEGKLYQYVSDVALLGRGDQVRAVVLDENSTFRASAKCALEDWVKVEKGSR